jgi:hypothetical protein
MTGVLVDIADPVQGIVNRSVTGAAAQVPLKLLWQFRVLHFTKSSRSHDHAGGAESALKALGIDKCLLNISQLAIVGQALNGRDFAANTSRGGNQAAMHGITVKPYGACATITLVTTATNTRKTRTLQVGAKALTGVGRTLDFFAVYRHGHYASHGQRAPSFIEVRSFSARNSVISRR